MLRLGTCTLTLLPTTHKPLLPLSRAVTFSSRPIISHLPTPLQTTTTSFRFSSLHPFTTQPRFLTFSPMAVVSDDGSGGRGDSGGSDSGGDGSAGGGGGGEGGEMWSFLSWYLALLEKYPVPIKALTFALLTLFGDLICQLMIDKVQSVDLKRSFLFTLLGFALVGSTLHFCVMKKLEPINTLASSVWWTMGFYWIVVGGQHLLEDSLHLWLTEIFPGFDVFLNIFFIGMTCIVFFALFFFIRIIALPYPMRIKEGASEEDIKSLPKYRFSQSNLLVIIDDKKHSRIHSCNGSHVSEISVHPDDSECCICLSSYVDGAELYRLPCTHHFHCGCISRWLRTKATCPLCKFNIRRRDNLV